MAKRSTALTSWQPLPMKPITLGDFTLTATGVDIDGRPSWDNYVGALEFSKRAHRSAGFWLADLLRYGESRKDWEVRLSQVQDATGLSEKTLKNMRAIGAIEHAQRREAVSFNHHDAVTKMSAPEQDFWLEKAATEGWTVGEFRRHIRAASRTKIIEGQAVLEGQYRVVIADCPWLYGDRPPSGIGAQEHYPGMTIEELCALPVAAHMTPDAVMFMWTTAPIILQKPGPREVLEAWGLTYKTGAVWSKRNSAGGHYFAIHHEHVLVATRGSCLPDEPSPSPSSVFTSLQEQFEHSEKPEDLRRMVQKLYTRGPYLELFARKQHEGWTCFGNDARLWAMEAGAQRTA